MATERMRRGLYFVMLLFGAGILAFWQLGRLPLIDVDEPVYGEVGREMTHAPLENWLTPHYNGQIWFDKPPLFYWLTAISMRQFGPHEFGARVTSAVFGVALVAVTYCFAQCVYPKLRWIGLFAGFIQATCIQQFMQERAAVTDMTLCCLLTLALLGLFCWLQCGKAYWIVLTGVMTGLAVLTKGPVALVLIGLQMIFFLGLTRQLRRLSSPILWLGFGLCLLVSVPWYAAMISLHGHLFIREFLEAQNIGRFLHPEHKETNALWFFIPVLLGLFFPWSVALPGALIGAVQELRSDGVKNAESRPALFLILWVTIVFVFFSLSSSKLITYIFPLYPAASILTSVWILRRANDKRIDGPLLTYVLLAGLFDGVFLIFGPRNGIAHVTIIAICAALTLSAILALTWPLRQIRWVFPGLGMAAVFLALIVSPTWDTRRADISEQTTARVAANTIPIGGTLYSLGLKHPSLVFYSSRHVLFSDDRGAAAAKLKATPNCVYAMRWNVLDDLTKNYGLHDYRIMNRDTLTVLIQSTARNLGNAKNK